MAGLAAAEALLNTQPKDLGEGGIGAPRLTLIEPSGRFGGVVETVRRDGWLIERSADNFLAARPEAVALVDRLGLTGEQIGRAHV